MNKFKVWCNDRKGWELDWCALSMDGTLLHRRENTFVPLRPGGHTVVFSIGLCDSNDVDIYDGDKINCIMEVPFIKEPFYAVGVVYSDSGIWMVDFPDYGYGVSFNELIEFYLATITVIGSIFEDEE